ncbi:MFS transporter [Candidatus Bathyarchaeota archaeon]|nr:MFS transporter [Candidatus Bathyarchaeota archaeon]MBT4321243.1 MFS transporter [Candidatus Bathyarchaeota archaeon]MBT4423604.1 MFS transporter [Candidatus Bathyarchaeota archaeon]MBT5643368.1 MFS transporter [Candidatus Bathyarchaeota archaeon]MBT6604989.1 MFS transporter [Candidatus Bathyarchaeota archaeon]
MAKPLDRQRSLLMLMIVQLTTNFRGGIISPILSLFVRSQGLTLAQIGLLGTASMLGWFIWEPFMGVIADRWNKRWMLAGSLLLTTILYGVYPMATGLGFFMVLEFLKTSIMSAYSIPMKALTAELLPSEDRGKAYGRYMSVIGFGGMVSPLIGGYISEVFGYDLPFYIAAAIGLVGMFAVFSIKYEEPESKSTGNGFGDLRSILTGPILRIFSVRGLFFFNMGFLHNFLPVFLNESPIYAASESQIGAFFSIFRFAGAAGRSILGDLCDRLGNKKLIIASLLGWVTSYLALMYTGGIYLMYFVGVLQGLSWAAADTSMMLHLISVMSKDRSGLIMGLYSEAENIGGLISTPTVGYLYQTMGSGVSIWFVVIALSLNAVYSVWAIREDPS